MTWEHLRRKLALHLLVDLRVRFPDRLVWKCERVNAPLFVVPAQFWVYVFVYMCVRVHVCVCVCVCVCVKERERVKEREGKKIERESVRVCVRVRAYG